MNLEQLRKAYEAIYGQKAAEGLGVDELMQLCAPHFAQKKGDGEEKQFTVTEKELQESVAATVGKSVEEIKSEMAEMQKEFKKTLLEERRALSKEAPREVKEKVGQFFKALVRGDMEKVKDLSEGTDANGGYLVHDEFMKKVVYVLGEFGIARKNCLIVPMSGKTKNVSALAGNVTAYWVDEAAAITASNPTFGRKTLTAKKLAGITVGTNELIEDAEDADVFDIVAELFANAFAEKEDSEVLVGDGTIFTGVLNLSGANIVTMAATKTAFSDITADDIIDLEDAVDDKYLKRNPKYYFHKNIRTYLRKLKDTTGQYLLSPASQGIPATLNGYPYETTDVMPSTSDSAVSTKFVIFGDLRFVAFGDRKKITTKVLEEATIGSVKLGQQDEQALRVVERVAVVALIEEAFAVLKTAAA